MLPNEALIGALLRNTPQPPYAKGGTVRYCFLDKDWFDYVLYPDPTDSYKYPGGATDSQYINDLRDKTDRYGAKGSFRRAAPRQMAALKLAFDSLEQFINLKFEEVSDPRDADIQFGFGDLSNMLNGASGQRGDTAGYAAQQLPRMNAQGNKDPLLRYQALIVDNGQDPNNDGIGRSGGDSQLFHRILMHEIGHALGLAHPSASYANGQSQLGPEDNWVDTMMSYIYKRDPTYELRSDNNDPVYGSLLQDMNVPYDSTTPQRYDILALQRLYDPNPNTNAEDATRHLFQNGVAEYRTLYDSKGSQDEIDASVLTSSVRINLAPGTASSIGHPTGGNNIAIAFGTEIENAIGGSGNDVLFGYSNGNRLEGGIGNDILYGLGGKDILDGGDDVDILNGGEGDDELRGGDGNDIYLYRTGDGNDTIIDSDKKGRILIEDPGSGTVQSYAIGALIGKKGQNQWSDPQGRFTLSHNSPWTLQLPGGGSLNLGEDFQDGDFGIRLIDLPAHSDPGREILGDRRPVEPAAFDNLDNNVTSGASPNREDDLYDSAGEDRVKAGGGNDKVDAKRGGGDILEGGDILIDSGGDDWLYADAEIDLEEALLAGQTQAARSGQGEWLSGGDGDDILIGAATSDILAGGNDADFLVGGGGMDLLVGDATAAYVNRNWTFTRGTYDRVESGDAQRHMYVGWTWNLDHFDFIPHDDPEGSEAPYDPVRGGDDYLLGQKGDDYLEGGAGSDALWGGTDNDTLLAGEGDDTYLWHPGGSDKIPDLINNY